MTDVHCHLSAHDDRVREFLIGRDFFGIHPWDVGTDPNALGTDPTALGTDPTALGTDPRLATLREMLLAHPDAGIGEIGLDRLKNKQISPWMRAVFLAQLALARELHRPVVLHGAKCWGEVVRALGTDPNALLGTDPRALGTDPTVLDPRALGTDPTVLGTGPRVRYLFHGFSRSEGLIPDIVRMGGFISVGPAVLNLHAVNYRQLVVRIPDSALVVETDRTEASAAACPGIREILTELAKLRRVDFEALERLTDANAERFIQQKS